MPSPEEGVVAKHFRELKRQNAEDLRRREAEGLSRGMEPFDLPRLRELALHCRSVMAPDEDSLKFSYYASDFPTMEDFAKHLLEIDPWADSSLFSRHLAMDTASKLST